MEEDGRRGEVGKRNFREREEQNTANNNCDRSTKLLIWVRISIVCIIIVVASSKVKTL